MILASAVILRLSVPVIFTCTLKLPALATLLKPDTGRFWVDWAETWPIIPRMPVRAKKRNAVCFILAYFREVTKKKETPGKGPRSRFV
jgi:hypothetical protein